MSEEVCGMSAHVNHKINTAVTYVRIAFPCGHFFKIVPVCENCRDRLVKYTRGDYHNTCSTCGARHPSRDVYAFFGAPNV